MLGAKIQGVAFAGAAVLALSGGAFAGADLVDYPDGYRESFTHYETRNRADERKQVVKVYANEAALESIADGAPLGNGSILVMDVFKAKLDENEEPVMGDDGFFEEGDLAFIAVMEKQEGWGEEYPEEIRNDGWEYAGFDPQTHERIERDYTGCFECHKPQADEGYIFTLDALKEQAGTN